MRLDIYLTKRFELQSRNKASELIKLKKVFVDGKIVTKPSFDVRGNIEVQIKQEEFFVSRAAYKLKYFLEEININLENIDVLDIGSSTGGFTQVLLQNDIKSVTCVDVGSNQLHENIKNDNRVIVQENTDIRKFYPNRQYDLVSCDVSFISILNILDDIDRLAKSKIILLYKPQFEVGRNVKRDKNGVVLDKEAIEQVKKEFLHISEKLAWRLEINSESKLAGKNGNVEELYYFTK
jgi:23S rRNA (cytidine1920-2'-O)/16S rRNA (cytidine1409-2'-O)-methyltransferase